MFLNAAKSFSSLTEECTDSLEFELLPQHIEQAEKLEKKVENRVRNVFKLALASVIRDLTETVSVSEIYNDDTFKAKKTLKDLQDYEDLKNNREEARRWRNLKEDLSWFVIYNEKLKSNMPYHFQRKPKRSKIMEANGIYYRKVLLKKKITLQLVRWFKKRMGIKKKISGEKIKRKLHVRKYKLMKPLIVRRLLKDIIACGFYSFMRERLIEILYDRKRKQLNKMKKAEKKYKSLVQFYQQKLAEANKFAVARRKIRERLIQLKILRIKTDVKTRIFKHLKRLGFSTTREAEDFHSYTMKHLQKLQKTGVSSTDHLVHFKSLNSDTFIKTIFLDLMKQGKLNARANTVIEVMNLNKPEQSKSSVPSFSYNPKARVKIKKKLKSNNNPPQKSIVIPFLRPPATELLLTSSQQANRFKRSPSKIEVRRNKPFKYAYRANRSGGRKTKNKKIRKTKKTRGTKKRKLIKVKKYNRKLLKTHDVQKNVRSLNTNIDTRKRHGEKQKLRLHVGRSHFPSTLKKGKFNTYTEKLVKSAPFSKSFVRVKDNRQSEHLKRRLHQMKKTGRSVCPGHNSDQLSTLFYKGLVDSLRSMVSHKSSLGSASNHTPTIGSDLIDKQSGGSDIDKASLDHSTAGGQAPQSQRAMLSRKQLASERMEAEKKRLEETVLRSVETRFKEMMMDVPKDKDLRITDKLGGYLARHAWRRFYMGKDSPCERLSFQQNSRNKPPPWGHYRLYKPLVFSRKIKYYLVVHGFDLTPRQFKSKKYPTYPVSYDALWFFSNILRDSKVRRNRIKYKYDFLRNDSGISQVSGSHRVTVDEKSLFEGAITPHLIFREEEVFTQEPEEDDVPPMFTLRQDLKSSLPEDRQSLQFRIYLCETETIELISIESQHNFVLIEKETSFVFPEYYKPEKKISKMDILKKKKKKNIFIEGSSQKTKEEKDTLLEVSFSSKPEKSAIDLGTKTFESRGVQVVPKTSRSTKVQVNAPSRRNTSTLVTLFDFTAEANKEKIMDAIKSFHSKTSDAEGSTSSDEFECERKDDPLLVTKSNDFGETLLHVQRILSSNIYKKSQMFYARYHVDPLSGKLPISYECVHLWTFHDYRIQLSQMTVNSIAPHPFDTNIIAVAYAKNELATRDFGLVCIWNIKNIFFPEQVIKFSSSINYIEFSHPTTISVALMGGFVAVINISKRNHKITMNTERTTTAGFLPIWQFSWFLEENGEKFPVSCGADGRMYRYRTDETFAATILFEATPIENKLRGINGKSDDFKTGKWKERPEMTACAQHPTDRQSYLVGTSEGTVHICSLLLRNHLEVFSAQEGRINAIKFHPHCEHVFLTVGGDFYVRIWAIGIFEPLLTYSARNDYTEDACFNEIWPELMISISGEFVDIWNIRRRVCVPVQSWSNPKQLKNTCIRFSTDGYSVIVGDVGGYVHSFRLSEMPCESKMKAEVLSQAIMSTLSERQDLIAALSKLGYPFSVTHIENFLKAGSSRKSDVL